jgi:hypothetical protein
MGVAAGLHPGRGVDEHRPAAVPDPHRRQPGVGWLRPIDRSKVEVEVPLVHRIEECLGRGSTVAARLQLCQK